MARKIKPPTLEEFDCIPDCALVSTAEQPYPIPDSWKWVRLGSVIRLLSGRDEPLAACNSEGYGIPYLMGASNFHLGKLVFERWIAEPKVVSKQGDLLLSVKGTVGKMVIQQEPEVNLSRQVMALRPGRLLNVKYLEYYLSSVVGTLESAAVGLIPGISRAILLELPLPLAPLPEQERIVEKLSTYLYHINKVVDELERYLEGSGARIENLLNAAILGHLTEWWRGRHGHCRDDWTSTTLGEAFKWSSGGTPSRTHPEYYTGSIPWVKSGELLDGVLEDTQEHITQEAVENSSAKIFPRGSVLIAMYGATIGRVGLLAVDAATNQAIAVAQSAKHTLERYLLLYLRANRNRFIALGKGGAQPNISQRVIKEFPYEFPGVAEQGEILRVVDLSIDMLSTAESLVEDALAKLCDAKRSIVSVALAGILF